MKNIRYRRQNRSIGAAAAAAVALALMGPGAADPARAGEEVRAADAEEAPFSADELYTLEGTDPGIEELLESGAIVQGQRFGRGPVPGARVVVNHERLEQLTGPLPPLARNRIAGIQHQAGHGRRGRDIDQWARWYQEDGNTQIFRLHEGDWQFRDASAETAIAGRIEAYSPQLVAGPDNWREWEGTFTIIQPHGATIFQLFHAGGQLWAFHLGMSPNGDISLNRRREIPGKERRIRIAENMVGRPLGIRIRTDGYNYEVYKRQPGVDEDWVRVTEGHYARAEGDRVQFRWGMYLGQTRGRRVRNDAMYFVTGTTIR